MCVQNICWCALCMYAYINVFVCSHIYIYAYVYVLSYIYIYIYYHTYVHAYIWMDNIYAHKYAHTYTYLYSYTYVHYVHTHVCICIYTYMPSLWHTVILRCIDIQVVASPYTKTLLERHRDVYFGADMYHIYCVSVRLCLCYVLGCKYGYTCVCAFNAEL